MYLEVRLVTGRLFDVHIKALCELAEYERTQSIKGVARTRQDTTRCAQIWACICVKMVSCNEPTNWMHRNTLTRISDSSLKRKYHRRGSYVQARVKGQGSHEFLGNGKIKIEILETLCIWYRQTWMFSWMILDLTDTHLLTTPSYAMYFFYCAHVSLHTCC